MEPLIFVEIVRLGHVQHRIPIMELPASIGRAYDNQVIVDDPFMEPHQARLQEDAEGRIWLRDLLGPAADTGPGRLVSVADGLACTLGRTHMRFRTPGHHVPPARRDRLPRVGIERWLARPRLQWGVLASALMVLLMHAYLGSTDDFLRSRAGQGLAVGGALLVWSGLWAFGTRLVTHHFRFLAHLAAASGASAFLLTAASVLAYFRFLFDTHPLLTVADFSLEAAGVAVFLVAHMLVAGVVSLPRLAWACAGSLLLTGVLLGLGDQLDGEGDVMLPLATELKPVPAAAIPTQSVDSFFRRAHGLREDVDRAALDSP